MRYIIVLAIVLLTTSAFAKIELLAWSPTPSGAVLILPKRSDESPISAIRNYVREFNRHPELVEINEGKLEVRLGEAHVLKDAPNTDALTMLVSANDPFRMRGARNQKNWFRMLESAGARVHVLPTVAGIDLSKSELAEFNRILSISYDGLLLLGGADVEPSFYNQKNRTSKNTVLIRDQYEAAMAKAFLDAEYGSAFGICRGMQLLAILSGCEMYQDIRIELPDVEIDHTWDDHRVYFEGGKRNRLAAEFGSKSILVNSIHHQAARCENIDEEKLKILARDSFGIIEAIQLQGGKGLAVQWHPERMKGKNGQKVMALFVQLSLENREKRMSYCSKELTGR